MPNVFSHLYQLDESISNCRVVGWYLNIKLSVGGEEMLLSVKLKSFLPIKFVLSAQKNRLIERLFVVHTMYVIHDM